MVLKLPLNRLRYFLKSLEGELLEFKSDFRSGLRLGINFLLWVCITQVSPIENTYWFYLVDFIRLSVVGEGIKVSNLSPKQGPSGECCYFTFTNEYSLYIKYLESEMSSRNSYKVNINEGESYSVVEEYIHLEDFITFYVDKSNRGIDILSPYEKWVLDSVDKLDWLFHYCNLYYESNTREKDVHVERIRQLINEVKELISSYNFT